MSKLINHFATRLRALFGNRREAERHDVELEAQLEPQLQARLLLSISLSQAEEGAADAGPQRPTKLIGSTRNVSETGLAIVLPTLRIGSTLITEENCALRIVLDIYPAGLVEMEVATVHHRRLDETEKTAGYLVGVRITGISDGERARYMEYLGTLERRAPAPAKEPLTPKRPASRARHSNLFSFDRE